MSDVTTDEKTTEDKAESESDGPRHCGLGQVPTERLAGGHVLGEMLRPASVVGSGTLRTVPRGASPCQPDPSAGTRQTVIGTMSLCLLLEKGNG